MDSDSVAMRRALAMMRRPVVISPVVLLDPRLSLAARGMFACAAALIATTHGKPGDALDELIAEASGIDLAGLDALSDELIQAGYLVNGEITDDPEAADAYAEYDRRQAESKPPAPALPPKAGHVYLIRSGEFHKIGISQRPPERFREIQRSVPYPIEVVAIWPMPTDRAAAVELSLHARFAEKRQAGEWFDLTPEDVAALIEGMATL